MSFLYPEFSSPRWLQNLLLFVLQTNCRVNGNIPAACAAMAALTDPQQDVADKSCGLNLLFYWYCNDSNDSSIQSIFLGKKDFLGIFVKLIFLNALSREGREQLEGVWYLVVHLTVWFRVLPCWICEGIPHSSSFSVLLRGSALLATGFANQERNSFHF